MAIAQILFTESICVIILMLICIVDVCLVEASQDMELSNTYV